MPFEGIERIEDTPRRERPDYETYLRRYGASHGREAAIRQAESAARRKELRQTLARVEATAERVRPGIGNFSMMGPSGLAMEQSRHAQWRKLKQDSENAAREEHDIRYGLGLHGVRRA